MPQSLDCAKSFGRLLARFHAAAADFEAPAGSVWTRVHPRALLGVDPSWIERLYSHSPADSALLVEWREQAASVLSATRSADFGMCHGEAYPVTCRFLDGSGGVPGRGGDDGLAVAELDWAGEGDRTYDLAAFRWTLALHANDQADELFSHFLDAYAAVRDVPNLDTLRAYVAARHVWSLRVAAGFADLKGLSRRAEFAAMWSIS